MKDKAMWIIMGIIGILIMSPVMIVGIIHISDEYNHYEGIEIGDYLNPNHEDERIKWHTVDRSEPFALVFVSWDKFKQSRYAVTFRDTVISISYMDFIYDVEIFRRKYKD